MFLFDWWWVACDLLSSVQILLSRHPSTGVSAHFSTYRLPLNLGLGFEITLYIPNSIWQPGYITSNTISGPTVPR